MKFSNDVVELKFNTEQIDGIFNTLSETLTQSEYKDVDTIVNSVVELYPDNILPTEVEDIIKLASKLVSRTLYILDMDNVDTNEVKIVHREIDDMDLFELDQYYNPLIAKREDLLNNGYTELEFSSIIRGIRDSWNSLAFNAREMIDHIGSELNKQVQQ